MVNMINRRAAITQAPQPGHLNGVLPAAPRGRIAMLDDYIEPSQTFVTCPNQDVVYGLGFFSLDEEPVVIQVPDFGDRFWVYALYDARTDQFGRLGKPYGTKPGFYLLVGPKWQGLKPAGITNVLRCPTSLANAIPRVFQDDTPEDKSAMQWGIDYFNRTGTAKSNMFDNRPNETQYFYTDYDSAGGELNGNGSYEITFAAGQEPPVNGFWSLTLYNDRHLFCAMAALGFSRARPQCSQYGGSPNASRKQSAKARNLAEGRRPSRWAT
ncbi:DUF1254 domain-containing protein [Microvirga zambiensis]|uniref:DUF1254 domain-containing protein n=1 Tax=Microvirga zambiensis TaxID=1402137 RepID=UPI001FE4532C|nr:DUF1254 domain-containing protein [Microvirga zambiensis]